MSSHQLHGIHSQSCSVCSRFFFSNLCKSFCELSEIKCHTLSATPQRVPRATVGPKEVSSVTLENVLDRQIRGTQQQLKLQHSRKQSSHEFLQLVNTIYFSQTSCSISWPGPQLREGLWQGSSTRATTGVPEKYTTPKNCEFKRRVEYGTSFTASSMRAPNKVTRVVP